MKTFDDIGVCIPEILLPREGTDLGRWAVIACDQFTSEPEYWRSVRELVGEAPSTLNMVLPEIELEAPGKEDRIRRIQQSMHKYLHSGLLESREGIIYVERRVDGRKRKGLLLCLDLERYDYARGSKSLIRATEGTIVDRLPPRMAIREGAALEVPHILVLIDDPDRTVIEPIQATPAGRELLYDFELMLGSGHLSGFALREQAQAGAIAALRKLARPEVFRLKYDLQGSPPVLLFAMGDGNHSLATAKAIWERTKLQLGMNHPARYALVEVENVHDDGLEFEPIHRVLFGIRSDFTAALRQHFGDAVRVESAASFREMVNAVNAGAGKAQIVGFVNGEGHQAHGLCEFTKPGSNLAVGSLQGFLDGFLERGGAEKLDYVHGSDVVERLGSQPGNMGFYLPRMSKSSLFQTVILDGALPRKTFSMGEAREKRFYMEARKIA